MSTVGRYSKAHTHTHMLVVHGCAQVKHKYTNTMAEVFRETFCWMPLAYVLQGMAGFCAQAVM